MKVRYHELIDLGKEQRKVTQKAKTNLMVDLFSPLAVLFFFLYIPLKLFITLEISNKKEKKYLIRLT